MIIHKYGDRSCQCEKNCGNNKEHSNYAGNFMPLLFIFSSSTVFEKPLEQGLSFGGALELAIARMVEAEQQDRRDRKTEMYLKTSRLRYTALLEDVICGTDRNVTKEDLAVLSDCSFIRRHENLLIQGKCGCGKSFLACALGRQACILGYRTVYLNMNSFVEKVAISKLERLIP